jgi:hypothetical protein
MIMKARFKVRFHLGLGDNYRKWQVTDRDTGDVSYYDTNGAIFKMTNCKLVNRKATAIKINSGDNKSVCAWIDCSSIHHVVSKKTFSLKGASKVSFNPRHCANWCDSNGNDIDNKSFKCLVAVDREVYCK